MLDFALLELPNSPNTYLVCDEHYCPRAEAHRQPVEFPVHAEVLRDAWFRVLKEEPRITYGTADDAHLQYEFVQRSLIFRFPDYITVRFVGLDEGRSTILAYSRSKYGRSDFGVNQRRIERWLDLVETQLNGTKESE